MLAELRGRRRGKSLENAFLHLNMPLTDQFLSSSPQKRSITGKIRVQKVDACFFENEAKIYSFQLLQAFKIAQTRRF